MSSTMPPICSEKEGSVVNLDLEDTISGSFHFMIYTAREPRRRLSASNCYVADESYMFIMKYDFLSGYKVHINGDASFRAS